MKITQSKGMLLLGVWLVLTGITPFLNVAIPYRATIMPLIALVAGVLILIDR